MKPLCSIVCPSRHRPELLIRMIESINLTASNPKQIEFCIRLHRDDIGSLRWIPQILETAPSVRIVIGAPMRGYGDLTRFYEEALSIAKGEWVWIMNDDVICETPWWDAMLEGHAPNHIIMPEIHKLGGSTYSRDTQNPFMWVPNRCWEKYLGDEPMRDPFDAGLWSLLRSHDWPTDFIPVTVHHQRAEDTAEKHQADADALNPEETSRH